MKEQYPSSNFIAPSALRGADDDEPPTLVANPRPERASWHVRLKLDSCELDALSDLGIRSGLAWREGMQGWKSLEAPRTTTLPPPLNPQASPVSLAALARTRSTAPPPRLLSEVQHPIAPPRTLSSIPVMSVDARPAPQVSPRTRWHGIVALSAGVGAVVSLLVWNLRNGIQTAMSTRVGETPAIAAALPLSETGESSLVDTKANAASKTAPQPTQASNAANAIPAPVPLDALPLAPPAGAPAATPSEAKSSEESPRSVSRGFAARRAESRAEKRAESRAESRAEEESNEPEAAPPVSHDALGRAVSKAARSASRCGKGPHDGKVQVTFGPSGSVSSVGLLHGFDSAEVNGCVLQAFRRVKVPAFSGEPVVVKKSVRW